MEDGMKRAIERICRELSLPTGDSYTQDWVYELPEEFRNYRFFSKYLAAYSTPGYGDAEKRLLVQLMLDVTNDLLQRDEVLGHQAWKSITNLLQTEPELHRDQIEYWALSGELLADAFRLTPLVRSLKEKISEQEKETG